SNATSQSPRSKAARACSSSTTPMSGPPPSSLRASSGHGQPRCRAPPGGDPPGNVGGVAPGPGDEHRAECVLERQPAEEESGHVGHAAQLAGVAVVSDDGEVDPVED